MKDDVELWVRKFSEKLATPLTYKQMEELYGALNEREAASKILVDETTIAICHADSDVRESTIRGLKAEADRAESFRRAFSDAMLKDVENITKKHDDEIGKLRLAMAVQDDEFIDIALAVHGFDLTEASKKGLGLGVAETKKAIAKLREVPIYRLKVIQELEERICEQRKQLTIQIQAIKDRNLAMDALHYVWCSGGCKCGVHRFTTVTKLTEEVVRAAELNTRRLREWFESSKRREARAAGPAQPGDGDPGAGPPEGAQA